MYSSYYDAESRLQDLVPNATSQEISSALSSAHGNVDIPAQNLLGIKKHFFIFETTY